MMFNPTVPQIRVDYSHVFPIGGPSTTLVKSIHQYVENIEDDDELYLRRAESEEQLRVFNKWIHLSLTLQGSDLDMDRLKTQYQKKFHSRKYGPTFFDLHGRQFQTFAVLFTNRMNREDIRRLSHSKDHSDKRLLRARVYAIGSRSDIGWNGEMNLSLEDQKLKKAQMLEHLKSLTLFDWFAPQSHEAERIGGTLSSDETVPNMIIRAVRQGTQEAVEQVYDELNDESKCIAWCNFANAHNVCGTYSVTFGGSQEEEVATNCDGAVLLGTLGELVETGVKSWVRGTWVAYKKGFHIPPGGNYCAQTRFVTGPKHVECLMIATAFADFRPYVPWFTPYSERSYFYSYKGLGGLIDEKLLEQRLLLDIEGVLKTCVARNVHTLVTGASGCGAFLHDPYREAKLWEQCLAKTEYQQTIRQVIFAVLDREDSDNWIAFSTRFNDQK